MVKRINTIQKTSKSMLNDNKFTVYFHIKLNSEKNKWFSNKRKKKSCLKTLENLRLSLQKVI